jgi:hypothetical protein
VQAKSGAAAPTHLAGILLTAVVVAAIVSLGVIQETRQRGEVLDLVEVTSGFVPADGERARIEWRQRRTSDDATVEIIDRDENAVRTLLESGALEGDDTQQVFHWNGRTDSGELAGPGRYRVEIVLSDQDRDIIPERSAINLREPVDGASGG